MFAEIGRPPWHAFARPSSVMAPVTTGTTEIFGRDVQRLRDAGARRPAAVRGGHEWSDEVVQAPSPSFAALAMIAIRTATIADAKASPSFDEKSGRAEPRGREARRVRPRFSAWMRRELGGIGRRGRRPRSRSWGSVAAHCREDSTRWPSAETGVVSNLYVKPSSRGGTGASSRGRSRVLSRDRHPIACYGHQAKRHALRQTRLLARRRRHGIEALMKSTIARCTPA
jgi:hypothetical protein